jgi:hypothetical protein
MVQLEQLKNTLIDYELFLFVVIEYLIKKVSFKIFRF